MFTNFLSGLLRLDPENRWTAWQALRHPFITGAEYEGPYVPDPDPLKRILKESHSPQSWALPAKTVLSNPPMGRPRPFAGTYTNDLELNEFSFGSHSKSSFVPGLSISSSLPALRSDPLSIPMRNSEFKESFGAHSYGDGFEFGSGSFRDSVSSTSGSFSTGSFSNQLSYHSPYTYGQQIPRIPNLPADYSWSDHYLHDRKKSNN